MPRLIGLVLAVIATACQAIALTSESDDAFGFAMFAVIAINAVIGLIAVLRIDPYSSPTSTDPRTTRAINDSATAAFGVIFLAVAVQVALGFIQGVIIASIDGWDDISVAFLPLLIGGLIGTMGGLGGLLIGLLIVWPLIKLTDSLVRRATGREVVPGVVPLSVLLMVTVAAAVFTVLAPHAETSGTPRGRGLELLIGVWFNYSGDSQDQMFAWIARGLQLAIAGAAVWLAASIRAAKKNRTAA